MAAAVNIAALLRNNILPRELVDQISKNTTFVQRAKPVSLDASRNPSIPPANGTCPFLVLPPEIRRQIFSSILPRADHDRPIMPSTTSKQSSKVRDLMLVNKVLCAEISFMLYEERTFGLVLYEGILDGGVEFLNSGRQRLQYRRHFTQVRFKRFVGRDGAFDFSRIKRLVVYICPSSEEKQKTSRHDPMCTQFMLRALIDLLQREDGSFGLNSLRISLKGFFSSVARKRQSSYPWWNADKEIARSTSIHGVSNLELILQPLLRLCPIQRVSLDINPSPIPDKGLNDFVENLLTSMTGKTDVSMARDKLDDKIEGAQDMLEDWLYTLKVKPTSGPHESAVAESDFKDVDDESWTSRIDSASSSGFGNFDGVYGSSLSADTDGYFDFPGMESASSINREPQQGAVNSPDTNGTIMAEEEVVLSSRPAYEKHAKNVHSVEEANAPEAKRRKLKECFQYSVCSNTRVSTRSMMPWLDTQNMSFSADIKQDQDSQGDLCMNDAGPSHDHGLSGTQYYKPEDVRALRHLTNTFPESPTVDTNRKLAERRFQILLGTHRTSGNGSTSPFNPALHPSAPSTETTGTSVGASQDHVEVPVRGTEVKLSTKAERLRIHRSARAAAEQNSMTPEERAEREEKRRQDREYLVRWFGDWPLPSEKEITRSLNRAEKDRNNAKPEDGNDEEKVEDEDKDDDEEKRDEEESFAAKEFKSGRLYRDF